MNVSKCHMSVWVMACSILLPGMVSADPCLLVYPSSECIYQYNTARYYTVSKGDSFYDEEYDRGGEVLLLVETDEIDEGIYQAAGLSGFEPSNGSGEGFMFSNRNFRLVIDGFAAEPTVFQNVVVVFDEIEPSGCSPFLFVNGTFLFERQYCLGDLYITTPTPKGRNYSDTMMIDISWRGCSKLRIWAFSDEDDDGVKDGGECFTAQSQSVEVPTEDSSWGLIKSLYK